MLHLVMCVRLDVLGGEGALLVVLVEAKYGHSVPIAVVAALCTGDIDLSCWTDQHSHRHGWQQHDGENHAVSTGPARHRGTEQGTIHFLRCLLALMISAADS
eukprot:15927509-Heterocapsa_arctica.AAC.1